MRFWENPGDSFPQADLSRQHAQLSVNRVGVLTPMLSADCTAHSKSPQPKSPSTETRFLRLHFGRRSNLK